MSDSTSTAPVSLAARESSRTRAGRLRLAGQRNDEPDASSLEGRVGRYRVIEEIARGGMGILYRAYDGELDREVALKIINSAYADKYESDGGEARLLRESQAIARLRHPSIIAVHEFTRHEGQLVVVMEYFRGTPLHRFIEARRPSCVQIRAVIVQAGRALQAAHDHGLVHRDVKPANLLVSAEGQVRVVDFGLARSSPDGAKGESLRPHSLLSSRITLRGIELGTLGYMAPELDTDDASPHSDQYSLAASLHESLYGTLPASRPRAETAISARRPKHLGGERVSGRVRAALRRALLPAPEQRFPSIGEFVDEIEPRRRPARALWGLGLAAVAAAAFIGHVATPEVCEASSIADGSGWNTSTAREIESDFTSASGESGAQIWRQLAGRIDRYVDDVQAARLRNCNERVAGELSAIVVERGAGCLDEREQRLAVLLDHLADADAKVVASAGEAVDELPSVSQCFDPGYLDHLIALPSDPTLRSRVLEARRGLDDAEAAEASGRLELALERLEEGESELSGLDLPDLWARHHRLRGRIFSETGRHGEAEAALRLALRRAEASGQSRLRAELWLDLTSELGAGQKRLDAAAEAAEAARVVIANLDDRDLEQQLAFVEAEILLARHEFARAAEMLRDLLAEASGLDRAKIEFALARALEGQGDVVVYEASPLYARALEHAEQRYGRSHPLPLSIRVKLANRRGDEGKLEEAEGLLRDGLEAARQGNWDSAIAAEFEAALGSHAVRAGRNLEGSQILERAIARAHDSTDAVDFDLAVTHSTLGVAYSRLGRVEEAIEQQRIARDLLEQSVGPQHPRLLIPTVNMASASSRAGRPGDAARMYEAALEIALSKGVGNQRLYALQAGRHHIDAGNFDEAGGVLDKLEEFGEVGPALPYIAALRAEIDMAQGKTRDGAARLEAVCPQMQPIVRYAEYYRARCFYKLGRAHARRGSKMAAESARAKALDAARTSKMPDAAFLVNEIEAWKP